MLQEDLLQINKLEEVKRRKTYLTICREKRRHQSINSNENIRYVDRTFEGDEMHNEMTIELAIEELKKFIPQATHELYQSYTKKLRETKANAT
eukprot:10391418-Ditylum_brightwellii.AAC.1